MEARLVDRCRCCNSDRLMKYLDLGVQPLANDYHKGDALLPIFPLEVMLCLNCYHSQLSLVVRPDLMFKNYLYVSGTTTTFKNHCEELARDIMNRSLKRCPRVLDIACNDGTLLGYFRYLGAEVAGVDPAENLRTLTDEKHIDVAVGYWGSGAAKLVKGKFDYITGTNVFAHVHDISSFIDECKEVLEVDGTVVLEFPYCDQMIEHCEFDTIYHEHLSYFLVNSFKTLVERKGLYIIDVVRTPIHGGSIRFYMKQGTIGHSWKVDQLVEDERRKGLLDSSTYVQFASQVNKNKADMRALLTCLRSEGKKVVGYGASAKGNTMLNHFEIDLDYIVDDNSMKHGYLTPGRNIPIKSTDTLKEDPELCIVILAWNFFDEIVKRIETTCGHRNHHFINYVPIVRMQ